MLRPPNQHLRLPLRLPSLQLLDRHLSPKCLRLSPNRNWVKKMIKRNCKLVRQDLVLQALPPRAHLDSPAPRPPVPKVLQRPLLLPSVSRARHLSVNQARHHKPLTLPACNSSNSVDPGSLKEVPAHHQTLTHLHSLLTPVPQQREETTSQHSAQVLLLSVESAAAYLLLGGPVFLAAAQVESAEADLQLAQV